MTPNKFLPLEQFTFIATPPELRAQALCVNIYANGRLNLNGKLAEKMSGKNLQIRFTEDAKHLCLIEVSQDQAIRFPKNGSKRLPSVIDYLKAHRMSFPARYLINYDETQNFWQGDYYENPIHAQAPVQSNSKKR